MNKRTFKGIGLTLASVFAFGLCAPFGGVAKEDATAAGTSANRVWETGCPFDENDWWTRNEDGSITSNGFNGDNSFNHFVTLDADAVGNYAISAHFDAPASNITEDGRNQQFGIVPFYLDANNYLVFNLWWRQENWLNGEEGVLCNISLTGKQNGQNINVWNNQGAFVPTWYSDIWVYDNPNFSSIKLPIDAAGGWNVKIEKRVGDVGWSAGVIGDIIMIYVNDVNIGFFVTDITVPYRHEAVKVGVSACNTQVTVSNFTVTDSDWAWVGETYLHGDYNYNPVAGSDMVATGSGWNYESGKITANTIDAEPHAETPYDMLRSAPMADYSVNADVNVATKRADIKNEAGLTVWEKDYANNLKANLVYENGGYTAKIYGLVGGTAVESTSKTLTLLGDAANLYAEKLGTTVTLFVDGVEACSYTNDALAGKAFAGVNARNAKAEFTNFGIGYPSALSMTEGAAVRLGSMSASGLKFQTNVDKGVVDAVIAAKGAQNVSFGTLIVPKDYLTDGVLPTFASLQAAGKKVLDIPSTGFLTSTDTAHTYCGSIVDILRSNYKRDFVGLGYMKVVEADGSVSYTYAQYLASNARSVYAVASAALGDVNAVQEGKYQYAVEGGYSPYNQAARDVLKSFVS